MCSTGPNGLNIWGQVFKEGFVKKTNISRSHLSDRKEYPALLYWVLWLRWWTEQSGKLHQGVWVPVKACLYVMLLSSTTDWRLASSTAFLQYSGEQVLKIAKVLHCISVIKIVPLSVAMKRLFGLLSPLRTNMVIIKNQWNKAGEIR